MLQIEPIRRHSQTSRYRGLMQACGDIWRREGIAGFWKGHVPAQLLSVIYGSVQFVSYDRLYSNLKLLSNETNEVLIRGVAGGCGGCLATLVSYPTDVLRTRFSSQGEFKVYTSLNQAMASILKEDGYRGFFRGLQPSLLQIFPYVAIQFGLYKPCGDLVKHILGSSTMNENITTIESMIAGGICGGTAKMVVYPFDLVKRRLQVQGFEKARMGFGKLETYIGSVECFRKTLSSEGIVGLFKGISPSLVKAVTVSALSFSLYEFFYNISSL
ncbi:mitochondrial thiamine pyrophosphate carrier-like isoform X2 [Artemia franciscana]|uniref:Mitochondrial thiamine pyrophosphate carrier n=1 Tax=Artemia franciscana TaxID=6661 RepID=A0AA88HGC4_ARTSF|nr:hypothetical protein QYM36_014824 [Artemia franciscana]